MGRVQNQSLKAMRNKSIHDYTSFFSNKAIELIKWSACVNNRIKSRKIYEAACHIEYYYRKRQTGDTSPDVHVWSGGCYTHASSLFGITAEARWRERTKKGDA